MAIKHPFTSNVTDIGGPTYVQPTHWNQAHNAPPVTMFDFSPGAAASFGIPSTAGPTGLPWPDNTSAAGYENLDFTYIDRITFLVGRASNANTGAVTGGSVAMRLQYMASGFPGSWYSFDATGGSAPFVSVATGNNASLYLASANGQMMGSGTCVVSAAAKALPQPLTTRIAGYGGNGSAIFIGQMNVYGF